MYLETLLSYLRDYNPEDKKQIITAYEFASVVHAGVVRRSGEPYIIHPLYVATLLAEMHADADTICAGLLHDCIEDGVNITVDNIASAFNETVAYLVDGVTKINKLVFDNNKQKADAANRRKIIESLIYDVRIFIIKLADRLHNMKTLEFHTPEKQKEIARETMELFVPFASLLGEFKVKCELEDLCFQYLDPEEFNLTKMRVDNFVNSLEFRTALDEVLVTVAQTLNSNNIPFDVKVRNKNVYTVHKKLASTFSTDIETIHSLEEIKLMINGVDKCYEIRDLINTLYVPIQGKQKDYIEDSKLNMYKALHTTIISPKGYTMQFQLQTPEMYRINTYGVTAYWNMLKNSANNPASIMQDQVSRLPFCEVIAELSKENVSDEEFWKEVKECILTKKITVSNLTRGKFMLPIGGTVADYIIKYCEKPLNVEYVKVNGVKVPFDHVLNNGDIIDCKYLDKVNCVDLDQAFATNTGRRLYHKALGIK